MHNIILKVLPRWLGLPAARMTTPHYDAFRLPFLHLSLVS